MKNRKTRVEEARVENKKKARFSSPRTISEVDADDDHEILELLLSNQHAGNTYSRRRKRASSKFELELFSSRIETLSTYTSQTLESTARCLTQRSVYIKRRTTFDQGV